MKKPSTSTGSLHTHTPTLAGADTNAANYLEGRSQAGDPHTMCGWWGRPLGRERGANADEEAAN